MLLTNVRALLSSACTPSDGGVRDGTLSDSKDALGIYVYHAVAMRTGSVADSALFAARRASEVYQLPTSDVSVDFESDLVHVTVVLWGNDLIGAG